MNKLSHYLSMASICRVRAIEDKERRSEMARVGRSVERTRVRRN
jgi:hypothetical protein